MKSGVGWALVLVLCLAAGLRGWAVHEYTHAHPLSDAPTIDEASYDAWAINVASGDWMGEEVFFQEPLYPYFLGGVYAVFGRDLFIVRLFQAALGVLTCWLVAQLGRRMAGDWAGVLAALLFACLPSAVLLPCLLLKPNLHLPLFCACALLLTRPGIGGFRRWFAIGLVGSLCALLRGNSLALLAVFFVWSILPRPLGLPSFVRCGSFILGLGLVLGPVAWRNHEVGGVWALTTSGAGTNLYGGNNLRNPKGVATELPWVRGVPEHEAGDWRREAERRTGEELDPGEVSRYWLAETARSVAQDPVAHAGILWNKLRATLGFYAVPDNHLLTWDARYVTALRLPFPGFGILAAMGLAGCIAGLLMRGRREALFQSEEAGMRTVLLLGLYLATIVLTVTSMRARMPLTVLLAPLAGAWVLSVYRGPRIKPVLLACAIGAFVAWPVFSAEERTQDLAERDYNLVVHQLRAGSPTDETRALVEGLVTAHPNTSRFRILGAELGFAEALELRAEGEELLAAMKEEAALEVLWGLTALETLSSRNLMLAHRLAGHIHSTREDWVPAEESFRSAREFDPEGVDLAVAHAQALIGRVEQESDEAGRVRFAAQARALIEGLDEEEVPAAMRADLLGRLAALGV